MSCCCKKFLELCRVSVCGSSLIELGVNAPADGEFSLVLDYFGVDVIVKETFTTGDPMNFSSAGLNENYKYTGKVLGPDGEPVILNVEAVDYDCVSFQTGLSFEA